MVPLSGPTKHINKRLTQNACLYGICGAVIVYTLVLNHLLKDFGMDKG